MFLNALLLLVACVALLIIGVSLIPRPAVTSYQAEKPQLSFRDYFDGPVEAWGIFTDRTGKVQQRFTVTMRGHWIDDEGVLEEHFEYSDGKHQDRTWKIKALPNGSYQASAGDIIGTASGQESGNAVNFRYTLALPLSGSIWHMQFDDWMYLVNEDTLINKATMSKWGIRLGEVTLFFKKKPAAIHVTQSTL
jgi:hypothetical protein